MVPLYSVWLAYTTVMGMKSGLAGMGGGGSDGGSAAAAAESKRQKKMEKRGGQRMSYR